jgi:general secretion pathway protein E
MGGLSTAAAPFHGPSYDIDRQADFAGYLLANKLIDAPGFERVNRARLETGDRVCNLLTRLGLIGERELAAALSSFLAAPLIQPGEYPDEPVLPGALSERFLHAARLLPLRCDEKNAWVASVDPLDEFSLAGLATKLNRPIHIGVAVPAEYEKAYERLYVKGRDGVASAAGIEADIDSASDADVERLRDLATEAPVIRLVTRMIAHAVETRASDIHIEPFETRLRLRFRVDGTLQEEEPLPRASHAAIVSRIKVMARLNIAERRIPQDGRTKTIIRGREIDLRVSTMPTLHGESAVIRILDQSGVELSFERLGFDGETLPRFLQVIERPHGIVYVAGPTGSGKTTTLYASLMHLNSIDRKIISVEDPVEYRLQGTSQIQVNPKTGLTFAAALRSILRQDPDIIMVGEVRDLETAQIAVQAALTGHLVLATLHTNTAAAAITRLLDMGIEEYLVASTVNGVAGQRLVRTLCPECKRPAEKRPHGDPRLDIEPQWRAVGCSACNGAGYSGRTSLLEVLPMAEALRELVLGRASASDIERAAVKAGMRTMFADGLRKVRQGITTIDEVLRVTREE